MKGKGDPEYAYKFHSIVGNWTFPKMHVKQDGFLIWMNKIFWECALENRKEKKSIVLSVCGRDLDNGFHLMEIDSDQDRVQSVISASIHLRKDWH